MPRDHQHHFPLEIFRLSWRLIMLQISQQIHLFGALNLFRGHIGHSDHLQT